MADPLSPSLAAVLGALQGISEFLPISSSGHLSLAERWLGIDAATAGHRFNIIVHAGTLLAVLVVYRRDVFELLRGLRYGGPPASRRLLGALVLATLPLACALIPAVEGMVVTIEGEPRLIGACLLVTAGLLTFSHFTQRRAAEAGDPQAVPSLPQALVIGILQLMAILPGISRAGVTIAGALALGLPRRAAARFSFLLSIPAILGAAMKESLALTGEPSSVLGGPGPLPYALGLITSLVVGLLSLRFLIHLLVRVGLLPFVPYLMIVGVAAIVLGGG